MSPTFPLSPSGISSIDANWGGYTKGGVYLLIGHANAGRPRHLMTTVSAAAEAGEHCLLISARPQAELVALAAEIGFDLPFASQFKQVRLLKSPPAKVLAALGDEGLTRALKDLVDLAQTHKAGRVVMDDFSSFVQFRVFDAFAEAFRDLVRDAATAGTTILLGLGEPANEASKNLLRFIDGEVAGTIHATSDFGGQAYFELIPGTAHVLLPKSSGSPFTEMLVTPDKSSVPPPVAPGPVPPGLEAPTLPPFELSIPPANGGGDGSDSLVDTSGPVISPPVSDATAATTDSDLPTPYTSGDTAWAQITPVAPADLAFITTRTDAFSTDIGDLSSIGYFVDSAAPEKNPVSPAPDVSNLEQAASAVQQAAYPELFAPVASAEPVEDFRQALTEAFAQRGTTPFLVMALRISADDPYADVFPAVTEGVRIAVGQSGSMLIGKRRLLALIPNAGADVAKNVFAILKAHLKTIIPGRADATLQHVNAMAVPNGEPFKTADALFAYAFEN